jgi:hypothetical protein
MRNGLNGRYGRGLESWNKARSLAADLIGVFYGSNKSFSTVLTEYDFDFPEISEVKQAVNEVLFHSGRDKIDTLARSIMRWDNWSVPFGKDARSGAAV